MKVTLNGKEVKAQKLQPRKVKQTEKPKKNAYDPFVMVMGYAGE